MQGQIYLGGGGSEADEANLWAEAFPPGSTVAIWPFAQAGIERRRDSSNWLTSSLEKLGEYTIDTWFAPDTGKYSLQGVDIVAIPGGNTFLLLHELRTSGLPRILGDHLDDGGSVYGGSAGAILLGNDIHIASAADANDVALTNFDGLDLLGGLDVLPHYTPEQEPAARNHANRSARSVLCLPETCGIVAGGDGTLRNVGPSPAYVIHEHTTDLLKVS